MPFVNDRIAEQQQQPRAQQRPLPDPKRASRFVFDPQAVMTLLRSRIVGQPEVLEAMEAMLYMVKADIGAEDRPLAVHLFLGPTGVGKTETVRLLAQAIHGRPDALCRIDMNTLAQEHYAAALTGAPPGYVGSKEGHTLFDPELIQGSFSQPGIVLFDELEKADRNVVRTLLNVLENGRLVLSAGNRQLDFRNTLIFMTSNVGASEAAAYRKQFQHGWRRWLRLKPGSEKKHLESALFRQFDAEFLNRIDRILTFQRLEASWLEHLVDIEVEKLNRRLAKRGVRVELDPRAMAFLCGEHDPRFGARFLARRIRAELEFPLSRALIANPEKEHFIAHGKADHVDVAPALL